MKPPSTGIWDPNVPFRPNALPVFYGWIIAGLGAFGIAASIPGQTIGVNVFSEKLIEALSITRSDISLTYMIGTTASGFLLPWAGGLYDRFGARRLVVLASFGLGLSLFYMSVVDRIAEGFAALIGPGSVRLSSLGFLVLGFFMIRFWGQGVLTLVSRNMVGKWWEHHRGKVLSISGIVISVCFSLAPKAFDALIEATDWRDAWRILGGALIVGMAFVGWLGFRDNPRECGLAPDGGRGMAKGQAGNPEFRTVKSFTRREALRGYPFWLFSLVFGLQACYFTAYSFHVINVGADVGMSKDTVLNLFFPAAAIGAFISLFVGWASDRWRLKYMMMFMAAGVGMAPLGLILRGEHSMPLLIVLGFGIAGGCFGTLSGAFMPRFFGLKYLGAISGFFMSLLVIASAVGPWLFSVAHEYLGSYQAAHWVALAVAIALTIGAPWADNPQRKLAAAQRLADSSPPKS